jgi:predicted MPP superfamily phosphohydrolase
VLSKLAANHTVYAVAGSPPVDRKDVLGKIYDGLPITLLETTRVQLQLGGNRMTLTGLPCTHDLERDGAEIMKLPPVSNESFDILLYHSPDLAPTAAELGYDLQLSGHTHGGQVRLPLFGALYTSSLLGKRYEAGRYQVGDMTLYVTRGLGLEGKAAPRVRFLCSPEIVLWEIGGRIS